MQNALTRQLKPVFNDAFGFISANFRQMATLCLPILFFTTVAGYSLAKVHQSTLNAFFVPFLFNLLVYPIYTAALIHLMVSRAKHSRPNNSALILAAGRQWAPLFILKLVMVLMIIAGSMLIIPGLWLWVRLSFAEFYLVIFGYNPKDALRKSLVATKPFSMLIFVILLMTYIPIVILDLLADRLIWALGQSLWLSMISNTVFSFVALFIVVILFRVFMESINREFQPSSLSGAQLQ